MTMPTKKPTKKQNWFRKYREDLWSASIILGVMVVMFIITLGILEILAPQFTSCAPVMCQPGAIIPPLMDWIFLGIVLLAIGILVVLLDWLRKFGPIGRQEVIG